MKKDLKALKKGYVFPGDGPQVLLLHGFTGSPYDLNPVAYFLHRHNCHVAVPLLKGHGTKPRDLMDVTAKDWLNDAKQALSTFDKNRPLIIGGLSMGALLSIILAHEYDPKALLLFSCAIHLSFLSELTVASAHYSVLPRTLSLKKLSGGSDILDPNAKKKTPAYKEMPVFGLMQFDAIRRMAKQSLPHIKCPAFLAFGKYDDAIDVGQSHQALMHALNGPIYCRFYDKSKHVLTLDYDKEILCHDIWYFLHHFAGITS